MKQKILVLIDSHERLTFFLRFLNAFEQLGYQPIFLSALPSIRFSKKIRSVELIFPALNNFHHDKCAIHTCLEYVNQDISEQKCREIFSSFYSATQKILTTENVKYCFIWNGARTQSRAVVLAANNCQVQCLYFELANIEGKIFVDPSGVSSSSWLYNNIQHLDKKIVELDQFNRWKSDFIASKKKKHVVSQAKSVGKLNTKYVLDLFFWCLGYSVQLVELQRSICLKIKQKIGRPNLTCDEIDLYSDFLFFPLQVSKDSQLHFHSEVNNFEALNLSSQIARKKGLNLVVKVHPAEDNIDFLKQLEALREKENFTISKQNTFLLVENATLLATINSSVGLEALIMDKTSTNYFGRSIFQQFDDRRTYNYLFHYLVEADYFSSTDLSSSTLQLILDRSLLLATPNKKTHPRPQV